MKNKLIGLVYFYIHFIVELVCFFFLSRVTKNSYYIWLVPFIYDGLAFVPQSMIGYISDKHSKINMGIIGTIFLIITYLLYGLTNLSVYFLLGLLCLGNAFLHISGAQDTLKCSRGKLTPVSLFVAGGSFGVISGKLLALANINPLILLLPILTIIPCVYLAKTYYTKDSNCNDFKYVRTDINPLIIILIAFLVVVVRGYLGYGIPTSWNKTIIQNVIFFCTMGFGKALGGILSDKIGIKKVTFLSMLLAIPFLCFGNHIMLISIIGVMFFSMTMAITLGILVSVLNDNSGLAFGITTIGLFLGTVPIFFIRLTNSINIILIIIMSLICFFALNYVLKENKV